MAKCASFSLDDHLNEFIDNQVATGLYANGSDVVCAALRLLEDHDDRLNALRAALIEGEESGPATEFDFDAFIAGKRTDRDSVV